MTVGKTSDPRDPRDSDRDCVLAWEAMPHALQGQLSPEQREWFDRHLARCAACREQFVQQQRLHRAMSLPVSLPLDEEAWLQRLLARIDDAEQPPSRNPLRANGLVGRVLVAAVLVQAVGLGVIGTRLWSMSPTPDYRTLSSDGASAPVDAIRLVPDPAMTVAEWDGLLRSSGLRVVAGPNDVGGYTVVATSATADRDILVTQLRGARGVLLAEPIAGTP